jgi:hypothetical protein
MFAMERANSRSYKSRGDGGVREFKISEIRIPRCILVRPQDEHRAAGLRAVWAMRLPSFNVQRSTGLVLLALIDEITVDHIEHFGNALMNVRRDYGTGLHDQMQHHRPQCVILVADSQRDVSFAWEWKPAGRNLRREDFLIQHCVLLGLNCDIDHYIGP